MKKKQERAAPLWQERRQRPAQSAPTPAPVLSPEAQQLIAELAPYGVEYRSAASCERCGCPLQYPLKLYPDTVVCCICYPGGHVYGHDRQDRILQTFPRRSWK